MYLLNIYGNENDDFAKNNYTTTSRVLHKLNYKWGFHIGSIKIGSMKFVIC